MMFRIVLSLAIAGTLLGLSPSAAEAALLTNGDFEDLSDWGVVGDPVANMPAGWRDGAVNRLNAAGQQSGANAIGGSGTSAFLPADIGVPAAERKEIVQLLAGMSGPVYRFEFDFASEDPGGSGDRSLSMSTRDGATNALRTTFRINGDGDFQSFSGTFQTLLPGAVVFDDDVSVTPLTHHLEMIVDGNNAVFDLSIIDSNGVVHSVNDSTVWRGAPPVGAGATGLEFNTFLSSGDLLIDNVSLVTIPEPATAVLVALTCFGVLGRMRRR